MVARRDHDVDLRRRRELPVRVALTPEAVAVEVDGGRLRTREAGCGPGVHNKENKEDKIAALVTLEGQTYEEDPQPEPPESFLEPRRVQRLVQQIQGLSGDKPQEEQPQEDEASGEAEVRPGEDAGRTSPVKRLRTAVATMRDSTAFGPMVAAEAQKRGFFDALRRGFLGDGAPYNWTIHRGYFPDFEAIVDLLHVLCYIYLAAHGVGADEKQRWEIYVAWLRACWSGKVSEVIEDLQQHQERVGAPPEDEGLDEKDPRRLVAEALSYLGNNKERMDYPRYRKMGLPITSSLAESLVGEFNARMKSKQKYFNRPDGAEDILQLRAAVLSEDDRLQRHFDQRPGNPYRRRRTA